MSKAASAVPAAYSAFISYASPDGEKAQEICDSLEARGFRCWIAPRDVRAGREYGDEIIRGIEQSRCLVLVLSEAANESVFVRREVERAVSKRKPVFPVRIEEVMPSPGLELFVSTTHWIDAWTGTLVQHVDRLARDLADESVLDDATRISTKIARRRQLPKWITAAIAFIGIVVAVVLANMLTGGAKGGGGEPAVAFTDIERDDLRPEFYTFNGTSALYGGRPQWSISVVASPAAAEAMNAGSYNSTKGFYSLDGVNYEKGPAWSTFHITDAGDSKRVFLKFESFDGEEIGPFEYELDFEAGAIENLKEQMENRPRWISCSAPGCNVNWTGMPLAAIDRLEYASDPQFADKQVIEIPQAEFSEYFDPNWVRDLDLPAFIDRPRDADRIHYRVVYRDGDVGKVRTASFPTTPAPGEGRFGGLPGTTGPNRPGAKMPAFDELTKEDIQPKIESYTDSAFGWEYDVVSAHGKASQYFGGFGGQSAFGADTKVFVSLDGKEYQIMNAAFSYIRDPSAADENRLFVRLVSGDGEEVGPFEYEVDFRGAALASMKESLERQLLSGLFSLIVRSADGGCSLSTTHWGRWAREQALPAIDRIEYAFDREFAEPGTIAIPRAEKFSQYFDRDWRAKQAFFEDEYKARFTAPEDAADVYYRVVYYDGDTSDIRKVPEARGVGGLGGAGTGVF